jgi:hypothetical protein
VSINLVNIEGTKYRCDTERRYVWNIGAILKEGMFGEAYTCGELRNYKLLPYVQGLRLVYLDIIDI